MFFSECFCLFKRLIGQIKADCHIEWLQENSRSDFQMTQNDLAMHPHSTHGRVHNPYWWRHLANNATTSCQPQYIWVWTLVLRTAVFLRSRSLAFRTTTVTLWLKLIFWWTFMTAWGPHSDSMIWRICLDLSDSLVVNHISCWFRRKQKYRIVWIMKTWR